MSFDANLTGLAALSSYDGLQINPTAMDTFIIISDIMVDSSEARSFTYCFQACGFAVGWQIAHFILKC